MSDRKRALRELDREERKLNRQLVRRMVTYQLILLAIAAIVGWARGWW